MPEGLGWSELPFAHGQPLGTAIARSEPADFIVRERLPWLPSGQGEHLYLYLRKTNATTTWAARQLAQLCDLQNREVSLAGMKDRQAITWQWFSLAWPIKQSLPDFSNLPPELTVMWALRHGRKLQRGHLASNRFRLILRQVSGDQCAIEERLLRIQAAGVPNYFGAQRFGRNNANVSAATDWLVNKRRRPKAAERGFWLSAARAWLFNQVLATRIEAGDWSDPQIGDLLMLSGSHSHFPVETENLEACRQRQRDCDVDVTGPLWGQRAPAAAVVEREQVILADNALAAALVDWRIEHARRPLRLRPRNLLWRWLESDQKVLELSFSLPPGGFATAVLREVFGALD